MKKVSIILVLILSLYNCKNEVENSQISSQNSTNENDSWHFPHFTKVDSVNPILSPSDKLSFLDPILKDSVKWEARNVLNPTAVVKDGKIHLLYRAQDIQGTSRIGLAISEDGIHFEKQNEPIFFPAMDSLKSLEWNFQKKDNHKINSDKNITLFDGVEDPRIIETSDGNYLMTYTSYDGKTARLCSASSNNLKEWTKHGPILKDSIYKNYWSKSGAVIAERTNNKIIAKKIDGKYWMYFGDTDLYMASSEDLINWEPAINEESGKLIEVLKPRPGYFDSRLVEPGPYALITEKGILLIYNSSNAANFNDPNLPKFTYAAGQALFSKDQPYKEIARTEDYFIYPDKDYEKVGEVNEVCFVEGLVYFKDKWFLYYGTADSKIAVAIYDGDFLK
ncbi:Predicted glycosyl hydrolase, GH43/DUF377 family [Flavobacteriaceae bacterium MAR_2010_188]|nr:Predicted glycosyl hydrolase, GH43/DUF377 family [Flavobacteriaceae bacterium MAR_2010_188]